MCDSDPLKWCKSIKWNQSIGELRTELHRFTDCKCQDVQEKFSFTSSKLLYKEDEDLNTNISFVSDINNNLICGLT